MATQRHGQPLGINGLGRIGKLCVWHHAARGHFPSLVVNIGREVGRDLEAVCGVIQNDSTYGNMDRFLFGVAATPSVRIIDRDRNLLEVAGMPVRILQEARNPADINWRKEGVRIVVDTTGAFDDPTVSETAPEGIVARAPGRRGREGDLQRRVQGQGRERPRGLHHVDQRHQPRRLRPLAPPPDLRRILHDDRARTHGQAAPREHAGGQRDDGLDEHGARGHQLADRPRRRAGRRCEGSAPHAQRAQQHGADLDQRRAGARGGHPGDPRDRLHGRLGAHPDPDRVADHPQRHVPDAPGRQWGFADQPQGAQQDLPGRRQRRAGRPARLQRLSRTSRAM